jgi:hypothetical protein
MLSLSIRDIGICQDMSNNPCGCEQMNQLTTHMNENNIPCSGTKQALRPNRIPVIGYPKPSWQTANKDWACAGPDFSKTAPAAICHPLGKPKEDQFIRLPKEPGFFCDGGDNKTSVMRCSRDLGEDNRVSLLSP